MTVVVPKLEASLVWDAAGHLAEVAVAALVDGELELLPKDAVQHAETCSLCAERVGHQALFAFEVVEAIALEAEALAREPRIEPMKPRKEEVPQGVPTYPGRSSSPLPPAPLPVPALIAALVVAAVSSGPWLFTLEPSSPAQALARLARVIAHAVAAARAPGVAELAWGSALLLACAGVAVARASLRARRHLSEGLR